MDNELDIEQTPLSSMLVGRESELTAFKAVLDRGQRAIIIVTGKPGTGKTVLLQAFEEMAKARRWPTAGQMDQRFLQITPFTDERKFYNEVLSRFDNAMMISDASSIAAQAVSEGFMAPTNSKTSLALTQTVSSCAA